MNGISDLTHSPHSESMKQTQDAIVTISPPYLQSSAPRHRRRGKIMHCEILVVQILETLDFGLGIILLIF